MILKADTDKCVQECVCGCKRNIPYSSLNILGSMIKLPACDQCSSLEVLFLNDGNDPHSVLVSRVFAKVATQG